MQTLIPMDDFGVFVDKHDTARVDSRFVARLFEKDHRHVLRDIENLDCSEKFRQSNFGLSSYISEQNKKLPCYVMTRDGFVFLAMGYRGKKAAQFKELYIRRFNEMEAFIKTLVSARQEFPLLTEKPFRVLHGIEKKTSIRPYLTQEQLDLLETLQKVDIGLLVSVPDYHERKRYLEWYTAKIKKED